MIDGGANICLTGNLDFLADFVEIPPLSISVAVNGEDSTLNDFCTPREYLPLTLSDGSTHRHLCFYFKNVVETIISPQAILASSNIFASWTQTSFKDSRPNQICFDSHDGLVTMCLDLECRNSLYYCPTDVFTVDRSPVCRLALHRSHLPSVCLADHQNLVHYSIPVPKMMVNCLASPTLPNTSHCPSRLIPTSKSKQGESEVWLLHFGYPGVHQLNVLPGNVTGLPSMFEYHPFWFINFKEQAQVCKKVAQRLAVRTKDCKRRFNIDFGFTHSSTLDYSCPQKGKDRVVCSYDYLLPAYC